MRIKSHRLTSIATTDVFGPLSTLNVLSRNHKIELSIIAESLDPVSTNPDPNPFVSSSFGQEIVPTHTLTNAPAVEVLLIPGGKSHEACRINYQRLSIQQKKKISYIDALPTGFGTRNANNMAPVETYIHSVFPSLKYVITICTGSAILAQTGLLDNRRATTNKSTWASVVSLRKEVEWVAKARWVVDDTPGVTPVWSSSGVSAGIDVTFAFIKMVYGEDVAESVANLMEYDRHSDDKWDPFAEVWAVEDK
ncbi:Siderophore iron transporter [Venturia inaequalis]|nr:Siderophore iron transporter [Venturia inaequalis]